MAIVYDVIQDVTPDGAAHSSYEMGSWLVAHYDSHAEAQEYADACNRYRLVVGISYRVEAIDEESPERHNFRADASRAPTANCCCGSPST